MNILLYIEIENYKCKYTIKIDNNIELQYNF